MSLKLVIVICRHGDRTPLQTYPNSPYSSENFRPLGPGELTNLGKRRMFEVGKILRKRYNEFLDDIYQPEYLKIITSNTNRTKMTAQLICAGLFPPACIQKWDETINWQPIPYSYSSISHNMLVSPVHHCDSYRRLYKEIEKSEHGQDMYQKFDSIFKYLEVKTGISPFRIINAFQLYMILNAEESYGLVLPEWTKEVYPDPLNKIACYEYLLENYSLSMKQQTSGLFLSELINDFDAKINNKSKVKFILYSGHECTIANLLIILNSFDLTVPNYGSYVMLELKEHDNQHIIEIYYQNSDNEEPKLLIIPEFGESCTYDLFKNYVSKYIAKPSL